MSTTSQPEHGSGSGSGSATLAAYRASTARYLEQSRRPGADVLAYLDHFAALVGPGPVLEIGSGPSWEADHLQAHNVDVQRTAIDSRVTCATIGVPR